MAAINDLLTEKLRPQKINEIILLDRVKTLFKEGQLTQNVLLAGIQGIGKTTLAKILASNYPTKYLNISSDRGIDTVRDTIESFASVRSIPTGDKSDDIKVVILDEMDGGTDGLFKALRATMEKFSSTCRFIGTCNYLNKIPDPIQSRFSVVVFNPQNKAEEEELMQKYIKRIKQITDKLKIEWESEDLIQPFIARNFPDLRKIVSIIQDIRTSGNLKITSSSILKSQYRYLELYKTILKPIEPSKLYQLVIGSFSGKSADVFNDLTNEFPQWIFDNYPDKENKIPQIITTVAEWDYKRNFHIDENLAMLAALYDINNILLSK